MRPGMYLNRLFIISGKIQEERMKAFGEWIKNNPWKFAVIILAVLCIATGGLGYGCGYVKGCNKAKTEAAEK